MTGRGLNPFARRGIRCGLLLSGLVLACGCATRRPATEPFSSAATARGYTALFRGESQGPNGRQRFRMAVALMPPDRIRFEFLGPVGGPRLIVAADDGNATALLPAERVYERADGSPGSFERLLGLPLDAGGMIALLTGQPMCRAEAAEQVLHTRTAATFGRTPAWYEVVCPPGEIRYQARSQERGGVLQGATVREGTSGAMILEVEYGDHEEGQGPRWPHQIRLRLARRQTTVSLSVIDGPRASDPEASMFTPPVPSDFTPRADLLSIPVPGLLGSTGEREK